MKGKLGLLVLVLLAASYFLEKQFGGGNSTTKKETADVITVTGQVTGKENGNAIANALVEVQSAPAKTRTDDNGVYNIPAKKGDLLVVSHSKYRPTTVEAAATIQDIQLTPKE